MKELIAFFVFGIFASRALAAMSRRSQKDISAWQKNMVQSATAQHSGTSQDGLEALLKRAAAIIPRSIIPAQVSAQSKKYEQLLLKAGKPFSLDGAQLIGLKMIAGLALVCLLWILGLVAGFDPVILVAASFLCGALGYFLPDFLLKSAAKRRLAEVSSRLPMAIDLLAITVASGMGFDVALKRVVGKSTGPLAEELKKTQIEIEAGVSRREALTAMSNRLALQDVRVFVSAVTQALQQGTPLAGILELQSSEIRLRRRLAVQEATATAPLKMLFPLIFFIMPALFIVVILPPLIEFF